MNQGCPGIEAQIPATYANSLGILNAESYDDRRGTIEVQEMERKQLADTTMPFGMRADSDERDTGTRRRKRPRIQAPSAEDDEEARKKARGRPRVDTKDETAADVSWTDLLLGFRTVPVRD